MALAPLSQTVFLTEDGSVPPTQPAVTVPPMGIAPSITLGALTLSSPIVTGTPSTGTIVGSSEGSFIADSVPGLTIDSTARSYVWDGSAAAATYAAGLTETHPDATNSGRTSSVTINAPAPALVISYGLSFDGPASSSTPAVQDFAWGTVTGQPSEETVATQDFAWGTPSNQASEETAVSQDFAWGTATDQPKEGN